MPSNLNEFLREVEAKANKELEKAHSEAKKIVITAWSEIVEDSPRDTSLFKHSNFIAIDTYDKTEVKPPQKRKDKEALARKNQQEAQAQERGLSLAPLKHNTSIYIYNRLSYADRLEAGHSTQNSSMYGRAREKARKRLNKRIK